MNENDYTLFKTIAYCTQEQLQKQLCTVLKRNYKKVINKPGQYLLAEGSLPLALVAHMDTVFKTPPFDIYFDKEQGVLWSPDGLGADDRAGVFAILKILQFLGQKREKPSIIFTCNEESGCIGASNLVLTRQKCPWDLKYIVQLDRRGVDDCVFYDNTNKDFIKFISGYGFTETWGTFSDISMICPVWGIAGVNLSIGYEDEHSETETLHIGPLYNTISKVYKMILEIDKAPYFQHIESITNYGKWWKYYPSEDDSVKVNLNNCYKCGKKITDLDGIEVKDPYGVKVACCGDCFDDVNIAWCDDCHEAFIKDTPYETECCDCQLKKWGGGESYGPYGGFECAGIY